MSDTLLHNPSRILVQLLLDAGQVASFDALTGWPAWWEGVSDSPDDAVSVYDTAGISDGDDMHGGINEHHGLQIRVRCSRPADGYSKIAAIRDYTKSVTQQLVNVDDTQYTVQALVKFGPILSLGQEVPGSTRSLFTVNGLMSVTRR